MKKYNPRSDPPGSTNRLSAADYPDGSNSSEFLVQPTTYLPENFTYAQNLPCPQRLPSMSTYQNQHYCSHRWAHCINIRKGWNINEAVHLFLFS